MALTTTCRAPAKILLLTQGYKPEIAAIVHQSIVRDIAAMNQANAKSTADGTPVEGSTVSYAGRAVLCIGIDEMQEAAAMAALG